MYIGSKFYNFRDTYQIAKHVSYTYNEPKLAITEHRNDYNFRETYLKKSYKLTRVL